MRAIVDYYLDPFTPLLEAIVRAEGGETAFVRALRCSFPNTRNYEEALSRAAKTLRNRAVAWEEFDQGPLFETVRLYGKDPWTGEDRPRRLIFTEGFIGFLGARWAPIGVTNDPTNLNAHWIKNVVSIYHQLVMEVPRGTADVHPESA